jgi:transcriptional regulator with XRE-family HTH domain
MVGSFLRSVRESRGMTQLEVGVIAGIAQSNLSAYENDRQVPSIDTLNTIVTACGYTLQAVAGPTTIDLPLARGGWTPLEWLPERDPSDPDESAPPMGPDEPMDARVAAIREILDFPVMDQQAT